MDTLKQSRNCRGAALVEYSMLLAGVSLVAAAALSMFGHKTNDLVAATAAVLPGAHADDNAPILVGKLIETAPNADGNLGLDVAGIVGNSDTERLGANLGAADISDLVVEP